MPPVKHAEIRRRRQRLGVKLGEFAKRSGVGYKTLANIECGTQRFVSIEVIHRIANTLVALGDKTEADDLLADEEQKAA